MLNIGVRRTEYVATYTRDVVIMQMICYPLLPTSGNSTETPALSAEGITGRVLLILTGVILLLVRVVWIIWCGATWHLSCGSDDFLLLHKYIYAAVPRRNQRLFRCISRSNRCLWSAVLLNFRYGLGSYALCRVIRYSRIYEVCMSPALTEVQRYGASNTAMRSKYATE